MPAMTISLEQKLYLKLGNKAENTNIPFSTMINDILKFYIETFDDELLKDLNSIANEKNIKLSELVNQILIEKVKELK